MKAHLLMILCLYSFRYWQDLSRWLASTNNSKPVLELTHDDSRARASRSHLALKLESSSFGSCLDRVGLEKEFYKKTSVYLV